MAKKKSLWSRWFAHRSMVASEGVLIAVALMGMFKGWITKQETLYPALRVGLLMLVTLTVVGGVYMFILKVTQRGLETTHDVVKALPIPVPMIAVHVGIFVGLFFLYSYLYLGTWWPFVSPPG